MKNKDPPEVCPLVLAVACSQPMKSKQFRKTLDDVKCVLGILVNLVKLLYELYKIVAYR